MRDKQLQILNQNSALTTFKLREGKYYKVGTEKALFLLILKTQKELRESFNKGFREDLLKVGLDPEKIDEIYYSIHKPSFVLDLKEENLDKNELQKVISWALAQDKEGEIQKVTGLKKVISGALSTKDINDIIGALKNYHKSVAVSKHLAKKRINFSNLSVALNENATRLKSDIKKSTSTKLEFNYINKKSLNIEITSSLIASVRFTMDKESKLTWLDYQVPQEILELLLIPEVYVPLESLVVKNTSGSYTIRMYGFLKDHLKKGKVELTKEEVFEFFTLPNSYKKIKSHFINKFLEPTLKEVERISGIETTYKLIPEYNFKEIHLFPKLKRKMEYLEDVDDIEIESGEPDAKTSNVDIEKYIIKAKKNIHVSKVWNKRVDTKIQKILEEKGEEYTVDLLNALYEIKGEVKSTLVSYINGILKRKPAIKKEKKKKAAAKPIELEEKKTATADTNGPVSTLLLKLYGAKGAEEKEEIRKKAVEKYLEGTGSDAFTDVHKQIFKAIEKNYIVEIMREIEGIKK